MKTHHITIRPLLWIGLGLMTAAFLAGCSNTLEKDLTTLEGHVEKSSTLRGTFCNGEGYKWYYQGRYSISGTCMNGMVFHLPLRED